MARLAALQQAGRRGGDADRNCYGHGGYGMYGLNVGIGNIDDDPELEILGTYDNHHIQAFNLDGVAIDTDPTYFTNRDSACRDSPLTWGQFIRYLDPQVEEDHYHLHTGEWPDRAGRTGCSGPPRRPRSPTSTATGGTR